MPVMEIRQGDGSSLVYRLKIPHKRTFLIGNTIIGLSNKYSGFSKEKIIIFQNGHMKYRLKETNRLNWALRAFLPIGIFFLCFLFLIFFPKYNVLGVFLVLASFSICYSFFRPQYVIFEDNVEIGLSSKKWKNSNTRFSMKNDTYQIYLHRHECYSLFKNGTQIAPYNRKLEKSRNKYLIYHVVEEPAEIIEFFCEWIDLFYYDDERGRIILKTFGFPDKHPEYTSWRPKDIGE